MSVLYGRFFDGKTSVPVEVVVQLIEGGPLQLQSSGTDRQAGIEEVTVSERIGNTARRVTFADGAVCELADNDKVDRWLASHSAQGWQHAVYWLERHWRYAVGGALATVVLTVAFLLFGVPVLASWTARALPASIDDLLGRQSLALLDRLWFEPSTLPQARQAELIAHFDAMRADAKRGDRMQLELRDGRAIGANAFALPDGVVVLTDQLVTEAQSDDEIRAVLAHEIGHVVHRHSLRMLLQGSVSALLLLGIFGDANAVSDLVVGLPTLLLHSGYSRDFEREADAYSRAWLETQGISGDPLGAFLLRLEADHGGVGMPTYFSSHPSAEERADAASAR